MDEFLSFVDGLNLAIVDSPPLRVIDLVGNILGFIPLDWAVIASIVLPLGAQLGMFALSKSLTDRYLGAANDRIFRPRELVARICTTAATQKLLGLSNVPEEEGGWKGALNSVGREVGKLVLKPSMPDDPNAGATEEDKTKRRITRRLEALEGAALPVSLDVPPPAKVEGFANKMQAHGVKFDEGVAKDKEKRRAARLKTLAEVEAKLAELEAKDQSKAGFVDHLAAKRAKDQRELLQRRIANAQLREKWETDEVLWLVIVDAAKDKKIFGIDEAENEADVAVISEEAFRREIELEEKRLGLNASMHEAQVAQVHN
ncbi:uncharacterized protein SCHCODRAFT_02663556 [Schizophyllum commune H4-8]|uniref:Uncharacterized protein n=1 Tax=Schizophyllum commune (strain H4-8 / FGSC 9210) TaxID=578458 RepID=D8PN37_SCHCM|nr:uncharacterized protein SCHCODRAFT_02663556 [Schizophyllum commune H4-8]KAI5898682.1 hypothetical protein SCHCODRAFT_02663556 [Schizophyllum commune H4-8]